MPEVELQKADFTSMATINQCLNFVEKLGKTGFFRSGNQPLILTEDQRTDRKANRLKEFQNHRFLGGKSVQLMPSLAHSGNFATIEDDRTGIFKPCRRILVKYGQFQRKNALH